jgi:hypothetical protein
MQRGLTLFLKVVISFIGFAVLCVCLLLAPEIAREDAARHPETAYLKYPFLAGVYLLATPVVVALYQAWKLADNMATDKTFTQSSVQAVKNIKYCAVAFSVLVAAGVVSILVFFGGKDEDVTGFVTMGFIFTFAASIIATFMAVLQRLLQNAVDIKSENDSTV